MSNIKKILFVIPPQEIGYGYINNFFWSQGLLYLSSFLKKRFGETIGIEICDGNNISFQECADYINREEYDLIGFHCVDHTKSNAVKLAKLASNKGCKKIIFGGAGPTFGPEQYILSMNSVDSSVLIGCCIGPGEYTIQDLILNNNPENIPNFIYRKINGITSNITKSPIQKGRPKKEEYLA